ncbi:MAG: phosphoribosyltransferase [Euryarchaeota archaeon]|nr:phosphoribosyltransferase [Euryarchaeota archaeon]
MAEDIKCRLVTWEDITEWTDKVARKMEASGFKPDIVIGLTRGGWVPARILCDQLVCKNLYSIKVEHWGITARTDMKAKLTQELAIDVKGKKVLMVDDITDTGDSLALSIRHVRSKKPKKLKTATLLHITHSKVVPDYYGAEVPKEEWRWFIFPWNFKEDLNNLIGKLTYDQKDPKDLCTLLKERYNIESNVQVLKAVVEHLEKRGRK